MLHDFDMISHSSPGEIVIYPIADVHLGALEHAETEWQSVLKRVERENAYLIIAGDLLNNSIKGAKFANPFEEAIRPRDAKRRMVEYLSPIKERILCVTGGNHEARSLREVDQDICYDVCAKLDLEHLYRENMVFMRVSCGWRVKNESPEATYTFCVTHGSGAGTLTGSSVNKNERFSQTIEGVDCFIAGHVHKGYISKPSKIVVDARNSYVSMRHYVVISCVSWLNYGGYAAKSMLLPAHVCDPQRLLLTAKHNNKRIITTW